MSGSDPAPSLRLPGWLPYAIFALATVAFLWPAISAGGTFGATDILHFATPYREASATQLPTGNGLQSDQMVQLPFVAEFWEDARQGDVQLWEPDVGSGMPLLTAVYNRVLAPWFVVLLALPAAWGVTVAVGLGTFAAQVGAYLLARRLGLGRAAATFVGVGYAFSGPVTAFVLRIIEVQLFPWLLLCVHGALTSPRVRRGWWLVGLAVVTAGTWFSGFPSGALFCFYAAAAFALVVAISRREGTFRDRARSALVGLVPLAVAVVIGSGIAALQLLPTYEFLGATDSLGRALPLDHRAPTEALGTAVSGRFLGAYQDGDWWLPAHQLSNPVESSMTVGAISLGLLLVLAVGARGVRHRAEQLVSRFFLPSSLLAIAGLFVAGPFLAAVHVLPFMSSNYFGRSRFVLALGIAITAGYALDRWLRARTGSDEADDRIGVAPDGTEQDGTGQDAGDVVAPGWPVRIQAVLVVLAVAVGVVVGFGSAAEHGALKAVLKDLAVPGLAFLVAAAAVALVRRAPRAASLTVVVALGFELIWSGYGFTPGSPADIFYPDSPAFDVVEDEVGPGGQWRFAGARSHVLPPHAAALLDLNDIRAQFPHVAPYEELMEAADPGLEVFDQQAKAILKVTFTEDLDVRSPALDAMSTRYLMLAPADRPYEIGAPTEGDVPAQELPVSVRLPAPPGGVRAIQLPLELADGSCESGWVQMAVTGASGVTATSRQLLRTVAGREFFVFPDLDTDAEIDMTLETVGTDCGVRVAGGPGPARVFPPADDTLLEVVEVSRWVVYERTNALPRAALADETVHIERPGERIAFIASRAPRGPVVVSGPDAPSSSSFSGGSVELVRDDADRVDVRVQASGEGFLVLRDVFAPGWHAYVDGDETPIVRTDHTFRGVRVPSGASTVSFRYRPATFTIGLGVSAACVVLLLVGAGLLVTRPFWRGLHPRKPE